MRRLPLSLFLLSFFAAAGHAAVTGVVVHEDGSPVAGATVRAFVPLSTDATAKLVAANEVSAPIATATTGDDGRFSLDAKGNPTVRLVITAADTFAVDEAADGDDAGAIVIGSDATQPRVLAAGKAVPNALLVAGDVVLRSDEQGRFPSAIGQTTIVAPEYAIPVANEMPHDNSVVLTRGATLRGKVVGPDNAPVADAVISLRGVPVGRTASDGTFAIAHAPEQWRALSIRSGNLAGIVTNSRAGSLVAHLRPAVTLSGTVTSSRGPVAGARVILANETASDFRMTITDAKGHYAFEGAVPGQMLLRAQHPSFAVATAPQLTVTKSTSRDIRVGPLARISGHVVDEENKPVAGALVSSPGVERLSTVSGRGGEYALRIAHTNGPALLVAGKSGYAFTSVRFPQFTAGEEKNNVTVKLQHGFPLQVRVIDRDRIPMPDTRVELMPSGQDSSTAILCSVAMTSVCRTGKDGLLNVRVPEGKYDVQVSGESVTATRLAAQTLTPRTSPLVVTVEHALEASGTVTFDDGTPAPNARVVTRGRTNAMALVDANGNFTLKGLSHGSVTAFAESADVPPLQSNPVTFEPPARNVRITFPRPAGIEGRVTDRASNQPVTSFTIRVVPKASTMMPMGAGVPVTSDDGSFSLTRVTPGQLDLGVQAEGYLAATMSDITVDPGRVASGIEVKLDRAAHLTGRITAGGKPVAGARVRRDARGVGRIGFSLALTDDGGDYALDVPPGEQTILADKDGFVATRKTVTVELAKDNRLDIDLDRGREVQGRAIDKQGDPVAGANVSANGGMSGVSNARTTTADDGSFTLSGLDPTVRYNVFAQKHGYVTATLRDVDVTSPQPLTITLDHGGTITGHVRGLSEADLGDVEVRVSGPQTWATGRADSSGNFSVSGVPDGHVTVRAAKTSPPMRESAPKDVDVANGTAAPIEIDFAEGVSVRGRVTRNGAPVIGGSINFTPRRGSGPDLRPAGSQIGPDGSYEVAGLSLGEYDVRLFTNFGGGEVRQYTVTGTATYDIDLQGGTVRGHVIDATTNAALTETMIALSAKPPLQVFRTATTDSDGRFSVETVPDGVYTVRATHDHYAPTQTEVSVTGGSAPEVSLSLSGGTPASVRVVDADTGATLDAAASVSGGPKKVTSGMVRGDDGALKAWLEPGQYTVNVFARGYASTRAELTVPGPEVRVPVSRGGSLSLTSPTGGMFTFLRPGEARPTRGATLRAGTSVVIESLAAGQWIVQRMSADGKSVVNQWPVTIVGGQTVTLAVD